MKFVEESQREVSGVQFKISYLNTSAKSGLNVTEAFSELGRSIKQYIEAYKSQTAG